MKLSILLPLLLFPCWLNAQTVGQLYNRSLVDNLMEAPCRTKRQLKVSEMALTPSRDTVIFRGLEYLYNKKGDPTPQWFDSLVFLEIGPHLKLLEKRPTTGLLFANTEIVGVYYGILNGPYCPTLVKFIVQHQPAGIGAYLYECCENKKPLR